MQDTLNQTSFSDYSLENTYCMI